MPPEIINPATGLLFMKVGVHDGEDFQDILRRKRREIQSTGFSFWGYGGGTCHPTSQVQPYARIKRQSSSGIYLVMEEIHSNHAFSGHVAREFSEDGINWQPMPLGIEVRGSRYALVLGELEDGDLDIDISHYNVAYGPSRGKWADDYVRGRIDKACIEYNPLHGSGTQNIKTISHYGKLIDPYAVFVRD